MTVTCTTCIAYSRNGSPLCLMHERLSILSHNLATAAGLCRAFDLGESAAYEACALDDAYESGHIATRKDQFEASDKIWSPGCGKAAP